jgi:hypothetical protein
MPWFQRLCEVKGRGYILFSKNKKDDDESKVKCTMISLFIEKKLLDEKEDEKKEKEKERGKKLILPDKNCQVSISSFYPPLTLSSSFIKFNDFNSFLYSNSCHVVQFAARYKDEKFATIDCKKSDGSLLIVLQSQTLIFTLTKNGMCVKTECSTYFHENLFL